MPARRPRDETARLGGDIYERDIRPRVEADRRGEYVAIDVESGGWAIAGELLEAAAALRAEHPDAVDVWLLRVGHESIATIGGGTLESAR